MSAELRNQLLLSVMRALWGEAFGSLRALACFLSSKKSVVIVFYVDGAIGDGDRESIENVVTEVISDFPDEVAISHDVLRVDYPLPLDLGDGLLVYRRKEPSEQ